MSDIVLSRGIRSNLLSLQSAAELRDRTQIRLATGKRVNTAIDNPSNFFNAASLNARSNDIANLLDTMGNAVKTIEAADAGLKAITKIVENAQAAARQALQTALSPLELRGTRTVPGSGGNSSAIPAEVNATTFQSPTANFAMTVQSANIYGGQPVSVNITSGDDINMVAARINTALDAAAPGTPTTRAGAATYTAGGLPYQFTVGDGANTATINLNTTTTNVPSTDGTTIANAVAAVNAQLAANIPPIAVQAFDDGGRLSLRATTNGATQVVNVGGTNAALFAGSSTAGINASQTSDVRARIVNGRLQIVNNAGNTVTVNSANATQLGRVGYTTSQASLNGSPAGTPTAANLEGTFTIKVGATTTNTISIALSDTAVQIAGKINTQLSALNLGTATIVDGRIEIKVADGNFEDVVVAAPNTQGESLIQSLGMNVGILQNTGRITRETMARQFNEARNQIDQLARDASFNGVNLLQGTNNDLTIRFNERGTSAMTIGGANITSVSLGIDVITDNFRSMTTVNSSLSKIEGALTQLRGQASTFGANLSVVQVRQNFTKEIATTLKTGADALTLADINEESANMLALQTRQQLSQQALSLANQADQGVLRLFG